jgi:hypothetical protein
VSAANGERGLLAKLHPGTILEHTTGGRVVLKHRKADESGWWNADKSGFSDVALREGLLSGDWTIVDPPEQGEVPEITYVEGASVPDALRSLADRFEADDDLEPVGLWNVESDGHPILLQVVVTHLDVSANGGRGS